MSQFSEESLSQFQQDGFAIERSLVSAEFCSRLRDVVEQHLEWLSGQIEFEADLKYPGAPESLDAEGGRTPRRLKQAMSRDTIFAELVMLPAVSQRMRQLLGPQIAVPLAHHNCVMTKQPGFSSDTGWHQDIRYWSFEKPDLVSFWLALGPETVENGCLHVIPGTHQQSFDRDQLDDELFLREDLKRNAAVIQRKQPVELQCGDALFFHAKTFHAASRNHTDVPKYSVVFTFRGGNNGPIAGTRSASLPELLLPPIAD
ncbi:MAG: phytanoyl-CoA dioxygenase family protein [Planctomycetaceae bacterium]